MKNMLRKLRQLLRRKSFWAAAAGVLTLLLSRCGIADMSAAAGAAADVAGGLLVLSGIVGAAAGDGANGTQESEANGTDDQATAKDSDGDNADEPKKE